jgi:hypothetical protein
MMSIDVDMLTVAQAQAIAEQTMVYFAKETPCDGLDGLSILTPMEFDRRHGGTLKPGEVGVEFRYDAPKNGFGFAAHVGLETTVFDAQGNVVWSQDWG